MLKVGTPPGFGVTSLGVSETGDTFVIGDGSGAIHLVSHFTSSLPVVQCCSYIPSHAKFTRLNTLQYSTADDARFNKTSYETKLETPRKALPPIDIDDLSQSLSFVPGFDPAPNQGLLSDFDAGINQTVTSAVSCGKLR